MNLAKLLIILCFCLTSCKKYHNLCYYSNTIYVENIKDIRHINNNQIYYVYDEYQYYIVKNNSLILFKNNC